MEAISCAFTGHRPSKFQFKYREDDVLCKQIKAALMDQIKLLYHTGVRHFYIGGAQGVDLWAGEAVLQLRKCAAFTEVRLFCIMPFPNYDSRWPLEAQKRLSILKNQCDDLVFVCQEESSDAYKLRNYYMVDHAKYLVAVYDKDRGVRSGTKMTVNYARKKERFIIYIHPDTAVTTT